MAAAGRWMGARPVLAENHGQALAQANCSRRSTILAALRGSPQLRDVHDKAPVARGAADAELIAAIVQQPLHEGL
eukprot:CAMPEP_0174360078 /NCGR_PEP_ID=MMETSP0811_2-20130205/52073_1 /TAXON_ID=73025 ORGANISM="Eutreptiella gymnastica-like, Strain CCMP1594" /NCGR_SAMPLE_ID=MMETSP0811_2 /ASSEMBLY_ACC=CAM_ASM_000667 /LENGTH=74 /DNA_ID=CAMNT_0015495407 /DNA_START=1121 /DNA_END=1342 /DNA_ORIENTATION=-